MHVLAAASWGAFFATASLLLLLALAAWLRSHRQVALLGALAALMSSALAGAYLGWLPLQVATEARLLAHVAVLVAVVLALLLMPAIGGLRAAARSPGVVAGLVGLGAAVLTVGWLLEPAQALALASLAACAIASAMLVLALRSAWRGDRYAGSSAASVACMLAGLVGLSWIALDRDAAWPVHAFSALAGMGFLVATGLALWSRYAYLIGLAEVMAHGPDYDPVTRMRSHSQTNQMLGQAFLRREGGERPLGVIVVCIGNLYALENLHGRAAFNHALFVCAARLRQAVPPTVETGRVGDDGFLLLVSQPRDLERMVDLARALRERLQRPVVLSTRRDPAGLEQAGTEWVAEVGIGVLGTSTRARAAQAVSTARAIARTAWSYDSRLAFFDQQAGCIAELPPPGPPAAGKP